MIPTREAVAEYLDYDPTTGIFRWKKSPLPAPFTNRIKPGQTAGAVRRGGRDKLGHRDINLLGQRYPTASLAWLLMTGEWQQIDHRNNNSLDERWDNLRPATQTQNQMNTSVRSNNTSGYKGVHPYKRGGRNPWVAQIGDRHIGYFPSAEAAACAYDIEALKLYGQFAYLNFPEVS